MNLIEVFRPITKSNQNYKSYTHLEAIIKTDSSMQIKTAQIWSHLKGYQVISIINTLNKFHQWPDGIKY